MSGSLIGGKHRKNYPSHPDNIGVMTQIRLPRPVSKLLHQEARKTKMSYSSFVAQMIIKRAQFVKLDSATRQRVERYAERSGLEASEAVNKLLSVALGYVDE